MTGEDSPRITLGRPGSRAWIAQLESAVRHEVCCLVAPLGNEIEGEPVDDERARGAHQSDRHDSVLRIRRNGDSHVGFCTQLPRGSHPRAYYSPTDITEGFAH